MQLLLALVFVCVWQLKNEITENGLLKDTITKYRDDADLQNLIDWVQADWASNHCSRGTVKLILQYYSGSATPGTRRI